MGGVHERARAEEEKTFEHGVIDRVVETSEKPQRRELREPIGLKNHPRADAHENDPDVLDAVVSQQALEVVFH